MGTLPSCTSRKRLICMQNLHVTPLGWTSSSNISTRIHCCSWQGASAAKLTLRQTAGGCYSSRLMSILIEMFHSPTCGVLFHALVILFISIKHCNQSCPCVSDGPQSASCSTSVAPAPSFNPVLWWRTTPSGKLETTEKFLGETGWKLKFTPMGPSGCVTHLHRDIFNVSSSLRMRGQGGRSTLTCHRASLNHSEVFINKCIFNDS